MNINIKYCPICKSELIFKSSSYCRDYFYCTDIQQTHFFIDFCKITYNSANLSFSFYYNENYVYISYKINNQDYKSYEIDHTFFIYYDKILEILKTDCSELKLRMIFKKIDNLLIFQ